MSSLNQATLIGNVGSVSEMRQTKSGKAVLELRVATNKKWRKDGGEVEEITTWHNVTIFSKLAEIISKLVTKGSTVYVQGEMRTDSWEKDGQKHYKTYIVGDNVQVMGKRLGDVPTDPADPPVAAATGRQKKVKNHAPGADNSRLDQPNDEIPF